MTLKAADMNEQNDLVVNAYATFAEAVQSLRDACTVEQELGLREGRLWHARDKLSCATSFLLVAIDNVPLE